MNVSLGQPIAAPAVPLTIDACWNLGMTAPQAAFLLNMAVSTVRTWAYENNKVWRAVPSSEKVSIDDVPLPEAAEVRAIDCLRLWVAVVHHEWNFAFSDPQTPRAALSKREAIAWFGSREFHLVCDYAGLNGVAVLERFRAKMGSAGVVA